MIDPTEREMLLKDEEWILLEIQLLRKELLHQRENLKDVQRSLSEHPFLSIAYKNS